jgi:hypothetical protein
VVDRFPLSQFALVPFPPSGLPLPPTALAPLPISCVKDLIRLTVNLFDRFQGRKQALRRRLSTYVQPLSILS